MKIFGYNFFEKKEKSRKTIGVDELPNYQAYAGQYVPSQWETSINDGSKFAGGYGATQILIDDYWTLRARSEELFKTNLYARGLIRRLVTNEIGSALNPEASPDSSILDLPDEFINDWSETVESRFQIWASNPDLCDWRKQKTFGALQREARREAIISGDVLIVLRQSFDTQLPMVQLVSGSRIKTPYLEKPQEGNEIKHGVELSKNGRTVAYWIEQDDGSFTRLVANSRRSGRKICWLMYGTDKRMDEIRGEPLLSIALQSLKELDRYRDAATRKAVINSMLAMFIKKDVDKMGSLPIQGSAVKNASTSVTDGDGTTRNFNISSMLPGIILDELAQGETPVGFSSNGTDLNFPEFETAILSAFAWANEMPPESLMLQFQSSYSASAAATSEFRIYLNKRWKVFGEEFCGPIYRDWLLSEVLLGNVTAMGLLDAWRDPSQYDTYGAWTQSIWYGQIKPHTDALKQSKASKMLIDEGWSTNAREARINTGTKFSTNIKRLRFENEMKLEAMRPLVEMEAIQSGTALYEQERDLVEEGQETEGE